MSGWRHAVSDLLEPALKEVQAARRDPAQICGIVSADVSDFKQATRIVEDSDKICGCAGCPDQFGRHFPARLCTGPLAGNFEHLMQVNYLGTVYVTAAVLPAMMKRGSGHIINLSSMAGIWEFLDTVLMEQRNMP